MVGETILPLARPARECIPLADAEGRVLAETILADRDQPAFHRSTRDGFAVRAAELPGPLRVIGEIAAGSALGRPLRSGEAAEIMTGAPLPEGADAVVMIERVQRSGATVTATRPLSAGENVVSAGSELRAGAQALASGVRIGTAEIAMLASVGRAAVPVYHRPVVAVVATGDELVDVAVAPGPNQIRESNGPTLAAQIVRAGGIPLVLPPAADQAAALRDRLERALAADLILFSGGVSMGKHDLVEAAFAELGARFIWDGVAIRPGKPAVFGMVRGKPFFGLPGNPLSTLVTFELLARPALELLAGATAAPLRLLHVRLADEIRQAALPLTCFVPARLEGDFTATTALPLRSQGSGDLAALARADGFVVLAPGCAHLEAGAFVPFLPR